MTLKSIKQNMTELEYTNEDGERVRVLFSYSTPVAAAIRKHDGQHFYKTEENFSRTTNRHIMQWCPADAEAKPQTFFESLGGIQ